MTERSATGVPLFGSIGAGSVPKGAWVWKFDMAKTPGDGTQAWVLPAACTEGETGCCKLLLPFAGGLQLEGRPSAPGFG